MPVVRRDADDHHQDEGRVDERLLRLARHLVLPLEVLGELVQDHVQLPALLACLAERENERCNRDEVE